MVTKKRLLVLVLCAGAFGLLFPLSNVLLGGPQGTALKVEGMTDPQIKGGAAILEKKCANCHVAETPRPWYARLPPASTLIEYDIKKGLQGFDLVAAFWPPAGQKLGEASLARLELTAINNDMPPLQFLLLHPDSRLGADERSQLRKWIRRYRADNLAHPSGPPDLRAELIRPLPQAVAVDSRRVALGSTLYHDKRLSGDGTISCASCHDLAKGGTDNLAVSVGIKGQKGGINSPTTFNALLNFVQFWDGRAADLQAQAEGPPANPIEMGDTWPAIEERLKQDPALVQAFAQSYPEGLTTKTITDAIAEFERTLLTPDSPFDRYLQGEAGALSEPAKRGYALFIEKKCVSCHVGELLGGQSFEKMGRESEYFAGRTLTDADLGRYNVTKDEKDKHYFKVPMLRNIALTAPYFHDASQAELTGAVQTMARYQTEGSLDAADEAAMVAFLQSLTGRYRGTSL